MVSTIGVAQTVDKLALLADLSQHFIDLRAAAVHDNDLDADQIEQYQIVDDRVLQLLVDHCVAAVFYDNGPTVIFLEYTGSASTRILARSSASS